MRKTFGVSNQKPSITGEKDLRAVFLSRVKPVEKSRGFQGRKQHSAPPDCEGLGAKG